MKSSIARRFLSFFIISFLVSLVLFAISYSAWNRPIAAIGFEALAAVLAALSISASILHLKKEQNVSLSLFSIALLYYALIEIGGAVEKTFTLESPLEQKTQAVLALDLLELLIVASLLILAIVMKFRGFEEGSEKRFYIVSSVIFMGALTSHGFVRLVILPNLNHDTTIILGTVFGISASILFMVSATLVLRMKETLYQISTLRVAGGLILFSISVLPLLWSLFFAWPFWMLSNCLQIVGLFNIYQGFVLPYLRKSSSDIKNSDIFAYSVSLMIIIPLLVTLVSELTWPYLMYINTSVFTIVRVGSTAMSITLTIFTYVYANYQKKKFLFPLIFIYTLWVTVGIYQLLIPGFLAISDIESLTPYVVATFFSLPFFAISAKWINSSKSQDSEESPRFWILGGLIGGIIAISISDFFRPVIISYVLLANPFAIGQASILGLSLVAIGELAYISFLIYNINRGKVALESLSAGFLSLWIMPNLLKGMFPVWTTGWWLSEAVLLIGLFSAPAILGYLYLNSSFQAQESEIRAKLYQDLLAHDISNYHQVILNSIELARLDLTPEEIRIRVLDEAYLTLGEADRLVRNVRKLGSLTTLERRDFVPVNLVKAISETIELVCRTRKNQHIDLRMPPNERNIHVLANDLLPDIFLNLLMNAIDYSNGCPVEIEISSSNESDEEMWKINILDQGPGIPPENRTNLFTRYMKGAQGSGLGLSLVKMLTEFFNGTVRIEDRIPGDYTQGSAFILTFPKWREPSMARS